MFNGLPHASKDKTSSKLDIKTEKSADFLYKQTIKEFYDQIETIPIVIKENARVNYFLNEDLKIKDLQDFQMVAVARIEKICRDGLTRKGEDWRKFLIGGSDRSTYEIFFRVEPRPYMSKAQFFTALRRAFGDSLVKYTGAMNKLYDSFDIKKLDQLEWRSFLYILTIVLQPIMPCVMHLKFAYALYASSGILDLDIQTKITLGEIKEMMCAPVLIALRGEIKICIDESWIQLVSNNGEAAQSAMKADTSVDSSLISFNLFMKLLMETNFARYMQVSTTFGKRDPRPWSYKLEEDYFHPHIVKTIKKLRRIARNEDEVREFRAKIIVRKKQIIILLWQRYRERRIKVRKMIIIASIRWRNDMCSTAFDWWRESTIIGTSVNQIQRIIRGFNARRRGHLIFKLHKRVKKMQSLVRQRKVYVQYRSYRIRRDWAAVTIQRMVRGNFVRRRVQSMIEAIYDTGVRLIEYERRKFYQNLKKKAIVFIQRLVRKFLKRRRAYHKRQLQLRLEQIKVEMQVKLEEARIEKGMFRATLMKWYEDRKQDYLLSTMNDSHTAADRAKILAYRNRVAEAERLEKERLKLEKYEKAEEERIEAWLAAWEIKKVERMKSRAEMCNRCLILAETPEELELRDDLNKRIKEHTKVVLRRADKQKIPMEVPEAKELATKEIIDAEVELERERCRKDQFDEATKEQERLDKKKEDELKQHIRMKKRARHWAAAKLQCCYRAFCSRRELRKRAYERYEKRFDVITLSYYYVDKLTRLTKWTKPKCLGSYDCTPEAGWVFMKDTLGDTYWYSPKDWNISYERPLNTYICEECSSDFAVCKLSCTKEREVICETCFNKKLIVLKEKMSPETILFKAFNGNVENSTNTAFSLLPDTNLLNHLAKLSAYGRRIEDSDDEWEPPTCSRCPNPSCQTCQMCCEPFCKSCYDFKHLKPPWDNHFFTMIVDPRIKRRLKKKKEREEQKEKEDQKLKKQQRIAKLVPKPLVATKESPSKKEKKAKDSPLKLPNIFATNEVKTENNWKILGGLGASAQGSPTAETAVAAGNDEENTAQSEVKTENESETSAPAAPMLSAFQKPLSSPPRDLFREEDDEEDDSKNKKLGGIWGLLGGRSGEKKSSTKASASNKSAPTSELKDVSKKPSIASKMMMASMRNIDVKTDISDLDRKIDIEQVL